MRIVFFGTPYFASEILEFLIQNQVNIVACVTRPDKPKGRSGKLLPPPVKEVAEKYHIPVYQPKKASDPSFASTLLKYQADLFVVVAYGEIIKQHLLDMPKLGCINVHASLLPKYRGAAPIHYAIREGEKISGVTIMQMVLKMDAGDILKQESVEIDETMNALDLEKKLCDAGKKALVEVLNQYETGKIFPVAQDEKQVSFAPKVQLEDCEVLWQLSAEKLHCLVRASTPRPGAWCYVLVRGVKKRMKIIQTKVDLNMSEKPGTIVAYGKEGIKVACGKGALELIEVQLEGKKAMLSKQFCQGFSKKQLKFL